MCLGNLKSTYLGVALVATTRGDLYTKNIITNYHKPLPICNSAGDKTSASISVRKRSTIGSP